MRPVAAQLFHADGQTNMTKLIVALRKPANELKTLPLFPLLSAFYSRNFASQLHYKVLKIMFIQNHEKFIFFEVYDIFG